jgi:hypothetical protein
MWFVVELQCPPCCMRYKPLFVWRGKDNILVNQGGCGGATVLWPLEECSSLKVTCTIVGKGLTFY